MARKKNVLAREGIASGKPRSRSRISRSISYPRPTSPDATRSETRSTPPSTRVGKRTAMRRLEPGPEAIAGGGFGAASGLSIRHPARVANPEAYSHPPRLRRTRRRGGRRLRTRPGQSHSKILRRLADIAIAGQCARDRRFLSSPLPALTPPPFQGGGVKTTAIARSPPIPNAIAPVPAAERWRGRGEPGILAPMHVPYLHMPGTAGRRAAKGPSKRPAVPARRQRR